jgi:hypothetical protein
MNERAELIKWWDTLDSFTSHSVFHHKALQMARECLHPDAVWLASLFPARARDSMMKVLLAQGDDPRAMHLAWRLSRDDVPLLLRRAAEMGYAPAVTDMGKAAVYRGAYKDAFEGAQQAAAMGDRAGLVLLARCFEGAVGCSKDMVRAAALFGQAAELGHAEGQFLFGRHAFGERDWRRYLWWGRSAKRNVGRPQIFEAAAQFLDAFEAGRMGRVLFEVAPVLKPLFAEARLCNVDLVKLVRVVELYELRCAVGKSAIDCWSIIERRLGVVKDIRVKIARLAWEQRWAWCGAVEDEV